MRKAFYSINFGKYDSVKNHKKCDGWDYVLFTNRDIEDTCYDRVIVLNEDLPFKLLARKVFINSHHYMSDYDVTFFVGGQIQLDDDISNIAIDWDKDLNVIENCNSCTYVALDKFRKYVKDEDGINRMIDFLKSNGYPHNYGMYASAIMVRKNNERIAEFEKMWWDIVSDPNLLPRDHMSMTYCIWKMGSEAPSVNTFGWWWDVLCGDQFSYYKHRVDNPRRIRIGVTKKKKN